MKNFIVWIAGRQADTWTMIAAMSVSDAVRLFASRNNIRPASCNAYREGFY